MTSDIAPTWAMFLIVKFPFPSHMEIPNRYFMATTVTPIIPAVIIELSTRRLVLSGGLIPKYPPMYPPAIPTAGHAGHIMMYSLVKLNS